MVWVVNSKSRTVTVYRPLTGKIVLSVNDMLDGLDVIPGFRIAVADIFGELEEEKDTCRMKY